MTENKEMYAEMCGVYFAMGHYCIDATDAIDTGRFKIA